MSYAVNKERYWAIEHLTTVASLESLYAYGLYQEAQLLVTNMRNVELELRENKWTDFNEPLSGLRFISEITNFYLKSLIKLEAVFLHDVI